MGVGRKTGRGLDLPRWFAGRPVEQDTAKDQHKKAIESANKNAKVYVLRHTALTQLANSGCDVFTLARIAGHSSITITQRYVHPQADAIERAFQQVQPAALPEPPND